MGIEIWFKEDLRNILISANASSAATALCAPGPAVRTYRLGYQAALMTVALACGIPPDQVGIGTDASQSGGPVGADTPWIEADQRTPVR